MAAHPGQGIEQTIGPVVFIAADRVLRYGGKEEPLDPRCIPILQLLVDNLNDEVSRSDLESAKRKDVTTPLKELISEIRVALRRLGVTDSVNIPRAGKNEGYRLRDLDAPGDNADRMNVLGHAAAPHKTEDQSSEFDLEGYTIFRARVDRPSAVSVFPDWEEADFVITLATESIIVIDSFFGDYTRLSKLVNRAVARGAKTLKVDIYMTSPETDFGAQRLKEKAKFTNPSDYPRLKKSIDGALSDRERYRYENKFHEIDDELNECISSKEPATVNLTVYEYKSTPSVRFIAVDRKHIVWGWYPLFDRNPHYECLYLEDTDLAGVDKELFSKLMKQIEHIENTSDPARDQDDRERKNFLHTILGKPSDEAKPGRPARKKARFRTVLKS